MKKGVKENIIITGLTGATLLSGVFLTLPRASAEPNTETVDRITITVPSSCSLSSTVDNPSHTATIRNHQYVDDIGETTIKATCNDLNGFSVYAIGFTDETDGKTVLSASTVDHTNDIITGTATGPVGGNDVSNWAMRLSAVDGTYAPTIENGFDEYSEVPATYTKVATFTSRTDQNLGSSLKTNYAVYVSGSQLADTYTGKVKYTMVHPSTNDTNSFVVNFFANGGTGTMSSQKISRGVATALSANTFTAPSGLGFAGWNTKLDGSGTTYANSASVTNLADAGESVSLYAMWQGICAGYTTMQSLSSSNIGTLLPNVGSTATVCDARDDTKYTIGKLADNKYWMLDNLALDLTNSTVLNAMNETNTHASNTTLGYLKNGGGTTSDKYAITGVVNWTDSPTYASGYSYSDPLVNLTNKDVIPTDTTSTAGGYKVGGYYNYCAASAGSYCYGNGTDWGTSSGNATEDICPKGWRMPTGSTSGEYSALANAIYGSTGDTSDATAYANYRSALHLPLSGFFSYGSARYQGSRGYWWSSTRNGNSDMHYLYAGTSGIYPASGHGRLSGCSVRCVQGS